MRPFRVLTSSRFIRPCAGVVLAAFLLASVGYPVWSGGVAKDLSQAFPCMYRQCGCRNAEQCWRGCCCFTNRQKLAWAEDHGVAAPDYVAAAAQKETCQVAKASCCSAKKSGSCHVAKKQTSKSPLTATVEALTCAGELERWVALGAIDIPRPEVWQMEMPLFGTVACSGSQYSLDATAPAPPPPWL